MNATGEDKDGKKPFNMNRNDTTENSSLDQSSEHRRTDHDRQSFSTQMNTTGQSQQIRDPDAMEVDTEPAHRADTSNLGLDSLQNELTSAFHLCKSCKISPMGRSVQCGHSRELLISAYSGN
jgi:hypothetical protein